MHRQHNFIKTFSFESENPWVDLELQRMKRNIFEEYGVYTMKKEIYYIKETLEHLVYCYQVTEDDEVRDNRCDIHIVEGEGERGLEGPWL
jgi:hypothetical protein